MRRTARSSLLIWLAALVLLLSASCGPDVEQQAAQMTGGDPGRGKVAVQKYGCAACHTIPGVTNANGLVGPSLKGIAARVYIGGVLENTPKNMIQWIRDPRAFAPRTAMPDTGVTEQDARDIAALLYTLRK
jgi:cytochrome c2